MWIFKILLDEFAETLIRGYQFHYLYTRQWIDKVVLVAYSDLSINNAPLKSLSVILVISVWRGDDYNIMWAKDKFTITNKGRTVVRYTEVKLWLFIINLILAIGIHSSFIMRSSIWFLFGHLAVSPSVSISPCYLFRESIALNLWLPQPVGIPRIELRPLVMRKIWLKL